MLTLVKTPLTPDEKRKLLVRVIRGIWSSLDSHLDPAVPSKRRTCPDCGSRVFDAECVREYADYIKDLSRLL